MQCNELELLPGLSQLSLSLNEACIDEIKGSLSIPVLSRKTSFSDLVCTPQGLARVGGKSSLLGSNLQDPLLYINQGKGKRESAASLQ